MYQDIPLQISNRLLYVIQYFGLWPLIHIRQKDRIPDSYDVSVGFISRISQTDEDPSLRIESFAIINLRGISTKIN